MIAKEDFERLEDAAYRISDARNPAGDLAITSIAISLKRIADALTTAPCNQYGETFCDAVQGAIARGMNGLQP